MIMKSKLMNILLNIFSDFSDDSYDTLEDEINDSDLESITNNDNSCACINKEQCSCQEKNLKMICILLNHNSKII